MEDVTNIDELIEDADWPKRTPDRMADLLADPQAQAEVLHEQRGADIAKAPDLSAFSTPELVALRRLLAKYSADQPRVPAGEPGGGEFGSSGEGVRPSDTLVAAVTKGARGQAAMLGMSLPKYQAALVDQMKKDLTGTQVRVRVPTEVLSKVLDDGRIKSQFETATSRGALSPTTRGKVEQVAFGIDPKSDPAARPIYGYLYPAGQRETKAFADDMGGSYGEVEVRLKDDVLGRTTFNYGDSLEGISYKACIPSYVNDPQWYSARAAWSDNVVASKDSPFTGGINYMEAQVQGGVKTSDIAEVVFTDRAPSSAISGKLDALGIKWSRGRG
jgi:hypothetical protein